MRVLSVVGARPQFVKLGPVAAAFRRHQVEHVIVHTGQHYDANLSDVFFADLGIAPPDVNLAIGSGSHAEQTGRMLEALEPALRRYRPDWVLVYGDTNSTLAAAIAAVKLHLPVAHLEAGLRSFNRLMPEEHNRVLTDHAADLLLAPTQQAISHLAREGLAERSVLVGDVMTDVCLATRDQVLADPQPPPAELATVGPYVIATLHRAENTDDPDRLASVLAALHRIPVPVALLAHPRLKAKADAAGLRLEHGSVRLCDPMTYPSLVSAVLGSHAVVTDSGGLQKEAFLLGVPCTTVRTETEWIETLAGGWNVLHPQPEGLAEVVLRPAPTAERGSPYGDGHAADLVTAVLRDRMRPVDTLCGSGIAAAKVGNLPG